MKRIEEWWETYIDAGTGCSIFVLGLMLIIGLIILMVCFRKCSKRYQSMRKLFSAYLQVCSEKQEESIAFHIERCETYYKSYFMWQFLSKIINILCLTCTFLAIVPDKNSITARVISVLGFLCIVSQIYLNPSKRAEQYLKAWRKSEYHLLKILSSKDSNSNDPNLSNSNSEESKSEAENSVKSSSVDTGSHQPNELNDDEREMMIKRINRIPKIFKKIEDSISSDAE